MTFVKPTVTDFKDYFVRDFPYGTDIDQNVLDADITRALSQAGNFINEACLNTQELYTQGYLLLAAHYLVLNLRNSAQGLSSSFNWTTNSRSVGGVSESYTVPDWVSKNPIYSALTQSGYGGDYLMMIIPCLVGPLIVAGGRTTA